MDIVPILIYIFTGWLCFKLGFIAGLYCEQGESVDEEAA